MENTNNNYMESDIYIHKKGILITNPIWVSLNNGRYKLYSSNPIQLSTTKKENTVKLREIFFIHSKKIDIDTDKGNVFTMQITKLDRWLRIGGVIVALLCMFYVTTDWTFIPTNVIFFILFGAMGVGLLLVLIFHRKSFFKIQQK